MIKRPDSDFTYELERNILLIYDQDMGNRSVTNDIENVLDTISKIEEIDIRVFKIAYQDSTKRFDGVRLNNNRIEFYSINGQSKEDVIKYFNK